jgi:hypothetical protein
MLSADPHRRVVRFSTHCGTLVCLAAVARQDRLKIEIAGP